MCKGTCAVEYPQQRETRSRPPTLPGLVCASWPETIAARSAQLGYFGFRDKCAHQQFIEPQAIECATPRLFGRRAWPGKRVALMRPNNGAPIDFARVRERDFAGFESGFDFIVGE